MSKAGSGRMGNDGAARRRHPEEGGYARGEETRARIIAAALKVFGEHTYEQASTRGIAAAAGVNPPALQYYFDSKEGLHRACAQHIIDRVSAVLDPALAAARQTIAAKDRPRAAAALCGLLDALADGLATTGSDSWNRFITRSKADRAGAGPAIALIHEHIGRPLMEAMVHLIALAAGRPARDQTIRLRAFCILGQITAIYGNRQHTLDGMGWDSFDERALALVKKVVREHTLAALDRAAQEADKAVPRKRR